MRATRSDARRRRLRTRSRLALALAALLGASTACGERPTRVVAITIDTLRADAFIGSADRASAMPLTRALAETGAIFEHFYSATNSTQPSHATLFTAMHPWQHGVTRNGMILGERHLTVAEHFREAGFTTAAVVASFPLVRRFGFAQGFDVYWDAFDRKYRETWGGVQVEAGGFYSLADRITDTAIGLLDQTQADKQFFWFHYFDPHGPFGDSTDTAVQMKELIQKVVRRAPDAAAAVDRAHRLYEIDVASLDAALDRLFKRLRKDAPAIETHILFVSDHGENFGEGGVLGHGNRLNPEQLRVPLFIVSPRVAPGRRTDLAGSIDITPTLLSLGGIDARSERGRDLTRSRMSIRGSAVGMQQLSPQNPGETGYRNRFYAVVDGVIYAGDEQGVTRDDSPRWKAGRGVSRKLEPLFRGFEREAESVESVEALDPESREGLRALGYLR